MIKSFSSGRSGQAIVIGGDCDGLAAAFYLARNGFRVVLLEAAEKLGGALATEWLARDFRISRTTPALHLFPKGLEREMKLAKHGLRYASRNIGTTALGENGRHMPLSTSRNDISAMSAQSEHDAKAFADLLCLLKGASGARTSFSGRVRSGYAGLLSRIFFLKSALFGGPSFEDLARVMPASIGDLLNERLETPYLKGALALDSLLGSSEGPFDPLTASRQILRPFYDRFSLPREGMGALISAMEEAARSTGVEITTSTEVSRILTEQGAVAGVELKSGEILPAQVIYASGTANIGIVDMLSAEQIDFRRGRSIRQPDRRLMTAKLNLALSGMPQVAGLARERHGDRLLIAPSLESLDLAYIAAKRGTVAEHVPLEVLIPSFHDSSLAPSGRHVMSVVMQYVPSDLDDRDRLTARVITTLASYIPDLKSMIIGGELLMPKDMDELYKLRGSDWYGWRMSPGRHLNHIVSPARNEARTPIRGFYAMAESDAKLGEAGSISARTIIADRRGS